MNIITITETGIDIYKSWSHLAKYTSFTKEDFTQVGHDYYLTTDDTSAEIVKDIKLLERVASDKVFAKQKFSMPDWLSLGTFCLLLYSLL